MNCALHELSTALFNIILLFPRVLRVLQVLSTALFNKPAFHNVIVNGLVLAEDGKKMSKRLKNYPDPTEVRICDIYISDW